MANNIRLWLFNKNIEIQTEISEYVTKISNIENNIYLQTINNNLYYGIVQNTGKKSSVELNLKQDFKVIDIECDQEHLYLVNTDGTLFKCTTNFDVINEICLCEEHVCNRGHISSKMKVAQISVGRYGQLFVTDTGELWGSGCMPQIGINSETPKKVAFFNGRLVHSVNVGSDFAIAIVRKQSSELEDEDSVFSGCPQCLNDSPSVSSNSDFCPKIENNCEMDTSATNIIFRNTEAAKDFLTRQLSRMSLAGEEFVECTEKPTRILKENMTNVASFVYESVKTVGDKVVTLSRHVSGSSDCNNSIIVESTQPNAPHLLSPRDESLSQSVYSEKDLSENDLKDNINAILKLGADLLNYEVWTWGNIVHGQLGIGDKIKRDHPMIITKLSNIGVQKVSVQNCHASVLTLDGRAYIWGKNNYNQVTLDNSIDQSSPKLYQQCTKKERIKDVICGNNFTVLLKNNLNLIYIGKDALNEYDLYLCNIENSCDTKTILFKNLLVSSQYTLLNVINSIDNLFHEFLLNQQKMLEEMLLVYGNVIKPLEKKSDLLNSNLYKTFTDLLYLFAANINSLLEYSNNMISLCDIVLFRNLEEIIVVYHNYVNTIFNISSIDGFQLIAKSVEVSQNLFKLRPELSKDSDLIMRLLMEPIDQIANFTAILEYYYLKQNSKCNDYFTKWTEFVDEHVINGKQSDLTREFWLGANKQLEFLKMFGRRLIKDSNQLPINLQNSRRLKSHRFILFNDLFVHLNGSQLNMHNLTTIWLEPQQDETNQLYQICLKMPEEVLILYTNEPECKIEWFHALQNAIKVQLNKRDALQPPSIRHGTYHFQKNGFFKDAIYTGRWLNGKMHGNGKIEWNDGKLYTGQLNNNQLSGFGVIFYPNVGTFEGEWKDNQQNGFGTFTYVNGDVYKGYFKDGQSHGHGLLSKGSFMANTASFYIGNWVMGAKNGYGVMDDIVAGEKYIGHWLDNKRHGNGLIVTAENVYYDGNFIQDVLTGQGLMIVEDGTHYLGEFRGTGVLNGKGKIMLKTGHVIEGYLNGSYNEGIKITNATFNKSDIKSIDLPIVINDKWKSLFKQCLDVLGVNDMNNALMEIQKIWQNVAVYLSNANHLKRGKSDKKLKNSLDNLDIIPPFGRDKLDLTSFLEIKQYLNKAFENTCHPLGSLLNDLSEAYTTTYSGQAHPLLLKHAIYELHYIIEKLYEIVRFLFPALPPYSKELLNESDDIINFQSLLYPFVLPKVHYPLFALFKLKNEQDDRYYKRVLKEWNKQTDFTLMSFLSVDQKFVKFNDLSSPTIKNQTIFLEAIEQLQQIISIFCPYEKLLIIRQTIGKMTSVAQQLLGESYVWNMDDLFPVFLFVVVRARIPDLGSELDFMDNFMIPSLESGELGIMYTTLKASYQQILQDKTSIH